jgi:tetratricopeptide (TPR) repeat protein
VADPQRLEELRRRVQKDPASLAFAQLAEECRRAGQCQEAVRVCREGLAHHPDYLSARVTLGRALLGLEHFDSAAAELTGVLRIAPENLAALRGLAEVHHRRGMTAEALEYYRAARALAPHDPEVAAAIEALEQPRSAAVAPAAPAPPETPEMHEPAPAVVAAAPPAGGNPNPTRGQDPARTTLVTPLLVQPDRQPAGAPEALRVLERWLSVIEARQSGVQEAGQ